MVVTKICSCCRCSRKISGCWMN